MDTDFISTKNSHVGNAIGAISGCIVESIDLLVKPEKMGLGNSTSCTVYSKLGKVSFETLEKGIEYAKGEGARYTEESARKAGADSVSISYDIKEKSFDLDGSKTVISVTVSVVATGKPAQMALSHSHEIEYLESGTVMFRTRLSSECPCSVAVNPDAFNMLPAR